MEFQCGVTWNCLPPLSLVRRDSASLVDLDHFRLYGTAHDRYSCVAFRHVRSLSHGYGPSSSVRGIFGSKSYCDPTSCVSLRRNGRNRIVEMSQNGERKKAQSKTGGMVQKEGVEEGKCSA